MRIRITLLIFSVLLVHCEDRKQNTEVSLSGNNDLSTKIDSIAQTALENGPVAGLSIAVMQGDTLLHSRGYGVSNIETNTPTNAETVYNMASVAKIITAAAVLKLADDGQLRLDDKLSDLLPDFPNQEQGRKITLRQLLNHTSGLKDYVAADYERWKQTGEPLQPGFVLDYVKDRPLDFEPATNWIYSNTGFYLAGLIIERVTKQFWSDYVLENITRALGLKSVTLCDYAGEIRTKGYDVREDGFVLSGQDAEQGVRGDAGLCASVLDVARLPGKLLKSGLLSSESLAEMLDPTILLDGVRIDYGLGAALGSFYGKPLWGHLGGNSLSHVSTLVHYPDEDLTIAILVNTRFGDIGALQVEADIARVVLNLDTPSLSDLPLSSTEQQKYLGSYIGDRGNWQYNIVSDGERLVRVSADNPSNRLQLLFQGNNTFGRTDWPMDRFVFHLKDDQTLSYSAYYNGIFDGYYRRTHP